MLDAILNNESKTSPNSVAEQLPFLLAMAHDRTLEGRMALADKLAEIFLSQAVALSEHEETMVRELIEELLSNDDPEIRTTIIHRFANSVQAPRSVALRIARGPIELAAPLLSANENLLDEDLIVIADKKEGAYAEAIARRHEIAEAVADALVFTGDVNVMQLVAENLGAKLSSRALEMMIEAARMAAMLQKPLLSRPEIGPDLAIRLYWWASRELRAATLDRYGFGPGKLEAALKNAIDEKLHLFALQKDDENALNQMADWLVERDAVHANVLPQLLRAGYYGLFNIVMSRLAKLDLTLINRITSASGGRPMVALCRAIGVDKGSFISIFLMSRGARPGEQIVHPQELSLALATFDRLTQPMAEAMLNSWRLDPTDLVKRTEEFASLEA